MSTSKQIEQAYSLAKARYAALGVDTEKALKQLAGIPVSIHCWQGDDVGGFESAGQELGGLAGDVDKSDRLERGHSAPARLR